mgnify:CR=1 FL=1
MNSFIWKNLDSYIDYGIVINTLPPSTKAEKNVEEIPIPGRNGDITVDDGTYKPITFTLTCTLLDASKINEVKSWLDGYSDLVFNWEVDRYYKAKLINRIDISQSMDTLGEFPLIFKAQPHAYALNNNIITISSPGTIYNPSSADSAPKLKVYGSGDILLNIGTQQFGLLDVDGYVTIDCEMMECYKDEDLKNTSTQGEFFKLEPGINSIDWMGNVSKIEIIPNWRWL